MVAYTYRHDQFGQTPSFISIPLLKWFRKHTMSISSALIILRHVPDKCCCIQSLHIDKICDNESFPRVPCDADWRRIKDGNDDFRTAREQLHREGGSSCIQPGKRRFLDRAGQVFRISPRLSRSLWSVASGLAIYGTFRNGNIILKVIGISGRDHERSHRCSNWPAAAYILW